MPYPVTVSVVPQLGSRNRVTTLFRLILAIPHLILVGGLGYAFSDHPDHRTKFGGEEGLLGVAAFVLAIVGWFSILFTGTHPAGIRQFTAYYLRWRARAIAYFMLLRDDYPPFGDVPYPATLEITSPTAARDKTTVALRLFMLIPHMVVLAFLLVAWGFTTVAAWFLILATGEYPQSIYEFGVGVLRWRLRFEAYALLMVDEYPPFSLQ